MFDIQTLIDLQTKPAPFTPGDAMFWTDPYIAKQLLAAHLDPTTEAASRPPEVIQQVVDWLTTALGLRPGDAVLDLGCGPGLYSARLAAKGLRVSGVDFSQNSIDYARASARQQNLEIDYRCADYLDLEDKARFDAALLIYGDFCPLSPQQRGRLLGNLRRALKPGGRFALDVTTPRLRQRAGLKNGWYASDGGFWRPGPHLVLEQGFTYEEDIFLDQYLVIEDDGKRTIYRNWFQDYTPGRVRGELEAGGFTVEGMYADLSGAPYQPESEWIGVIAHLN